jgi:hypothetical protein
MRIYRGSKKLNSLKINDPMKKWVYTYIYIYREREREREKERKRNTKS